MGGKGGDSPPPQPPPAFKAQPATNLDAERAAAMKTAQAEWQAPRFNQETKTDKTQKAPPVTALPDTQQGLGDVLASSMSQSNFVDPQKAAAAQQAPQLPISQIPLTGGSV